MMQLECGQIAAGAQLWRTRYAAPMTPKRPLLATGQGTGGGAGAAAASYAGVAQVVVR